MKRLLKGGMIMLGLMAGCSPQETTAAPVAPVEVAKGKVAVVYYSQSKVGNTATVATPCLRAARWAAMSIP